MIFYSLLAVCLGFLLGLVINYLADVLPFTRRFTHPVCTHCQTSFPWKNYLLLQPCPGCQKGRSRRTWITPFVSALAALGVWLSGWDRLPFPLTLLLLTYLGVVFVIDFEHRLILHPVSWFGAALTFGLGVLLHGLKTTLIGGALGYGIMFLLYLLGIVFSKWMARRRGITPGEDDVALGFGDVNLSGVAGLLLGWQTISSALLTAILMGGLASALVILVMAVKKQYRPFTAIPYAPFIILATLFILFRS